MSFRLYRRVSLVVLKPSSSSPSSATGTARGLQATTTGGSGGVNTTATRSCNPRYCCYVVSKDATSRTLLLQQQQQQARQQQLQPLKRTITLDATVILPRPPTLPQVFPRGGGVGVGGSANKHNPFRNTGSSSSSGNNSKRFLNHQNLRWFGLTLLLAQYQFGEATNFFEHKFQVQNVTSEDLMDLYGTEDIVELFCVFPWMASIMMDNATFEPDGKTIHSVGLLGRNLLQVSVDFDEGTSTSPSSSSANDTTSTTPNNITWFNKRETFHDVSPPFYLFGCGITIWKMTQNFGFKQLDDNTYEVYHHGETFQGLFPLRLLFQLHSKYVAWKTHRYIQENLVLAQEEDDDANNSILASSASFNVGMNQLSSSSLDDEKDPNPSLTEEHYHDIPITAFKEFVTNLHGELEQCKLILPISDWHKRYELDVTMRRLKTVLYNMDKMYSESEDDGNGKTTTTTMLPPRLHTIRPNQRGKRVNRRTTQQHLRRRPVSEVHLIVDDDETKDTLQTAIQQISASYGRREDVIISEIVQLTRRTSIRKYPIHPKHNQWING